MKALTFVEVDVPSFVEASPEDIVTYRFAAPVEYLPTDIDAIPSIASISFTPATISLGGDLGERATFAATFTDHRHIFNGEPFEQGSFWGKWRARYGQRLRGRAIRWIQGLEGQTLAQMDTKHFVIECVDGPNPQGAYTIQAKDILKLADSDRAQAPRLSNGALVSLLDLDDTAATLSPTGIGNVDYPASGYVAIGGEEIVAFVRDATAGNDANAQLMLHCEGADASTTFTDSSANARTPTANGNAQVDTGEFKFGAASALFDGTGDFISFADNAAWTFAGDFTLECQARISSLAAARTLICHSTDINNMYRLFVTTAGALTFAVISASVTTITLASTTGLIVVNTWYHLAVTRNGNVFKLFIDGVEVATTTDADAIPNFTSTLKIGISGNGTSDPMAGHIDEVRISSVARWTDDFTPPIGAYQTSSDIMIITRGELGTIAVEHEAGARVQLCLLYTGEDPANIIADLLENYAGVDGSYIPITSWLNETENFLQRLYSTVIAEPTSVNLLISELIEQAALAMWWDATNQIIRLQVLRAIPTTAAVFDEDNTLENSLRISEQPNARISQVWTYFGQRNPLEEVNKPDNYRSTALTVDLDAETDYGTPAIKKIFSRWIPFGARTVALRLNDILLGRYRDPPRKFALDLFRYGPESPVLGGGYRLEAWPIQDMTGLPTNAPMQITRLNPLSDRYQVEAEEMLFQSIELDDLSNRILIIDANINNVNLRDLHDSIYPEPDGGESPAITVTCIIEASVIVGSSSTGNPAFDVGEWPAGIDITVNLRGRIQGAGGEGGVGDFGTDGLDGGLALYARENISLILNDGAGEIWGGAGGGAGGSVGAGGGGAGQLPGPGGDAGLVDGSGDGDPGTTEAGGNGGHASFGGPAGDGSDGGDPGQDGDSSTEGVGGTAGLAIDGLSFITKTGSGDIRGDEVN